MDFWQYTTILHARLPRVKCEQCNLIRTIKVDWSRPGSGFTWLFETELMQLMKEMPVAAVSRKVREHDTRLWRVFHHYVNKSMSQMDLTNIKRIAIDETSTRRGHNYVTLFVDMDTKRVVFATEGKDSTVLATFLDFLTKKGVNASSIQEVCSDMSPAFIKGVETTFPNAHLTFDRFHVMKLVNVALDQSDVKNKKLSLC
jgi:transposase